MGNNQGINNNSLKSRNRGLLFRLLATGECNTRIALSRVSGLTKMSVTNIIAEFISQGLVVEGSEDASLAVGRNPVTLAVSPEAPKLIGALIHRDSCGVVLCDFRLKILKKKVVPIGPIGEGELMELVYRLIDEVLAEETKVLGIGAATLGPVDIGRGEILSPTNFYGIEQVPVAEQLRERYDLPVFFDIQHNGAALAEKLYGAGRPYDDFIYLGITNGIGSGIICGGQLYKNANGLSSEIGHTSLDFNGPDCRCGNRGCLETYASTNVICRDLNERKQMQHSFAGYCRMADDPVVAEALEEMVEKITHALVNTVNILNPQAVILGHESIHLPDRYVARLEEELNRRKLSGNHNQVRVLKSVYGEDTQLAGSVLSVISEVFSGKLLFG